MCRRICDHALVVLALAQPVKALLAHKPIRNPFFLRHSGNPRNAAMPRSVKNQNFVDFPSRTQRFKNRIRTVNFIFHFYLRFNAASAIYVQTGILVSFMSSPPIIFVGAPKRVPSLCAAAAVFACVMTAHKNMLLPRTLFPRCRVCISAYRAAERVSISFLSQFRAAFPLPPHGFLH